MSDDDVVALMAHVRENLHHARLSDGSTVPRESEAERAVPLLTVAEGRLVIDKAIVSAFAEWCALDWEANYLGFMSAERRRGDRSGKQLAFIGMLHGNAMQYFVDQLSMDGAACPPEARAQLKERLQAGQ